MYANKSSLASQGYYVSDSFGGGANRNLSRLFINENRLDINDFFAKEKASSELLRERIKEKWVSLFSKEYHSYKHIDTWIISSELLHYNLLFQNEINSLKEFLNDYFSNIHVVLYLREPIDLLVSHQSEVIKYGGKSLFIPNPGKDSYIDNLADRKATLLKWSGVFGEKKIISKKYSKGKLIKGNIIDDFCDSIGIQGSDSMRKVENYNLAYGFITLLIVCIMNILDIPSKYSLYVGNVLRKSTINKIKYKSSKRTIEIYKKHYNGDERIIDHFAK